MPDRTPTGGLRERLAEAIRAAAHWCGPGCVDEDGEPDCTAHPARTVYAETETDGVLWNVSGAVSALADAVMHVIEAETASKDAEIERLTQWRDEHRTYVAVQIDRLHREREHARLAADGQRRRADDAENKLIAVDALWDEQRKRAEEAERQRDEARTELAEANFTIGRQTAALAGMQKAEAERDEALAAAQRVRDLCARMRSHPDTRRAADRIEVALDQPKEVTDA